MIGRTITKSNILLGKGAYGEVYDTGITVTKIFTKKDDINYFKAKLPIIFKLLTQLDNPSNPSNPGNIKNIHYAILEDINNNNFGYIMSKLKSYNEIRSIFKINPFNYFKTACRKIESIHSLGIIHCDLKIDNLMYHPDISNNPDYNQELVILRQMNNGTPDFIHLSRAYRLS